MTPLLLAAALFTQDNPAPTLKVMTYNIRFATAQDGINSWPHRRDRLMALIQKHDPDVLGVQEALASQIEELKVCLPGHDALGVGRDDGLQKGEYSALFTRRSRLGLREGGTRWISPTPLVPGSLGGTARLPRVFSWGEFFVEGGGRILLMNAHLDHESEPARRLGGVQMREFSDSRSGIPAVAMGDFNSGPDGAAVESLEAGGVFRALLPPSGPFGTFCQYDASRVDGEMIDHILVTKEWEAVSVEIDRTNHEGRAPSDHFPVIAVLRLRSAG
jgi:endonuclease/exonuclease/phosphatase family metal-dependent hydrolase